jgi:flagellar biosynthesis protein
LPQKRKLRRVSPAVTDKPASGRSAPAPPGPAAGASPGTPDLAQDLGNAAENPPRRPAHRPAGSASIAVAVRHEPGDLPKVVASGRGAMAEKILEIAFQAGIKVREDADLAQMLAAIEANCPIPVAAFEAVAEILNYLYRANQAAAGGPRP